MTAETAIRTTRLTKDYGHGHGLFGLDLEVRRGEILGFLDGPLSVPADHDAPRDTHVRGDPALPGALEQRA